MTVAICTVRPGAALAEAVASVLPQLGQGQLLVVRSGTSEAATPPELAPFDHQITVVAEPQRSSAAARVAALGAAAHEVVLFLDDDCIAEHGWVAALSAAMAPAGVAAAGGTILPRWPGVRPRWVRAGLAPSYGERLAARTSHQPFAANMALRVPAVLAVGGFDIELGHHGPTPGLHEETELADRLRAAGHTVAEAPGAVVHHRIRPDQVRRRWVLRRCWHEGRSDALVDARRGRDDRPLRIAKLAALVALVVPAQLVPAYGTYVAARALVNAGYLLTWRRPSR